MLHDINFQNLSVNVIEKGTFVHSDLSLKLFLFLLSLVLVGFLVLFLNLYQKEYKEQKYSLTTLNLSLFSFSFSMCFIFVLLFLFSLVYSSSSNPTTDLQYLREDEYIIELTEDSDLVALTDNYSVYLIDNTMIAREGKFSCYDSWEYFNRVDGKNIENIFNTLNLSDKSLIKVSLDNLGVNIVKQGEVEETSRTPFLIGISIFLLVLVGSYVYSVSKNNGMGIPKKVSKVLDIFITVAIVSLSSLLLVNMFVSFTSYVGFGIRSTEQTKELEHLRTDEYIIEVTDNTDFATLSDNYCLYELEGKIILRDGYASNSWKYSPKMGEDIKD